MRWDGFVKQVVSQILATVDSLSPSGLTPRSCTRTVSSQLCRFLFLTLYGRPICNRTGHYIFAFLPCGFFFLSFYPFSSPNLSRLRLDVCHTSTHGVPLVRIHDAGLKRAARGSLKMQDARKSPKIAIWAPSHNFVGLYLRN